ncbi:hypothetical protein BDU57DRAFT_303526 [Ampelomyces quisqualis]|uniref:Uncharacterized protein n=1 Tax=Ampelomyces quisqualis TaxID=50730 RepID=A0A6A5QGW7_AMPQU|nr:hypothetical protein BDU57DRAFT_303526 [Ampelomyces quisqualis]
MSQEDERKFGALCGLAKLKFEGVEAKKQKRSYSEPPGTARLNGHGKLHKPPQVPKVSERPRNRLRKQAVSQTILPPPTTALFVLEFEPYPHLSHPSKVLGIYSTFDSVSLGAFKHGAYTFSREGLLDGSEYLNPTGRIRIVPTSVQQSGVRAIFPERSQSLGGETMRLDIPHPESQAEVPIESTTAKEALYMAVREGPRGASWIGVFQDKSLAWGASLKDKAMCAMADPLCDEQRTVGVNNMPLVSGRLVGSGRYVWKVEEHWIDSADHTKPLLDVRDV